MGRRSEHTPDQIKSMALDAAAEILEAEGLASLSTRNIAKRMGYTAGTLYQAFANLDDLVLQLNQRTIHGMGEALQGAALPRSSAEQSIRSICKAYLDFGRKHLPQWELLFQRQWPAGFVYPSWYMAEMGKSLTVFERELQRLMGPKATPHQVTLAGRAVWCAMHGIHGLYASGRLEKLGVSNLDELVNFQIEMVLRGLDA